MTCLQPLKKMIFLIVSPIHKPFKSSTLNSIIRCEINFFVFCFLNGIRCEIFISNSKRIDKEWRGPIIILSDYSLHSQTMRAYISLTSPSRAVTFQIYHRAIFFSLITFFKTLTKPFYRMEQCSN